MSSRRFVSTRAISSAETPSFAISTPSSARRPWPIDADIESTTWISRSLSRPAATWALLMAPDRVLATLTETMASAPSAKSRSSATWKSPGLAAAVLGNGASGAVIRAQNSSVLISMPALKVSAPKLTTSGTIVIPSAAARTGSMSDAESVTMATRPTVDPPSCSLGRDCRGHGQRGRYPVGMNRSLWAVLLGTFTLRFSTGLTGATLTFYLAHLGEHRGIVDQVLGLGSGQEVSSLTFGLIGALFYVSELVLSPFFGI